MSSFLTSDTLIDSVVRRASIPQAQVTFQPEDFLAFANEEMQMGLVPSVLQFHEEFFVYSKTISLINNVSEYEIPNRAIGNKVRTVYFLDANQNPREMARISPDDIVYYQRRSTINYPAVFFLKNNKICLVPDLNNSLSGSLYISYFQRPNQLVDATRIANITAIDYTNGILTVDNIPSVFTTSSTNLFDLIELKGGHQCVTQDLPYTTIDTPHNMITFGANNIPSNLAIGDMVCLAGESYVPQVPDELHVVLAQRVACRCLEAMGDAMGLQAANQKLLEMEQKMGNVIDNRTEGQPQKINNLRSPLRFSKMSYRRTNL